VRTTVDLDAPLLARARRQAEKRGLTLSGLVREAVSTYLAQSAAEDEDPFMLLTCGEAGAYAPSPAEMAAELERDDARHVPPAGRPRGRA